MNLLRDMPLKQILTKFGAIYLGISMIFFMLNIKSDNAHQFVRNPMMKFRIFPLLIFILAILQYGCSGTGEDLPGNNPDRERFMPVAGYEITPRDLSRTVHVSGTVEPLRYMTIASQMSGTIRVLHVEEGDRIGRGDIVATLDVSEQRAELERATALRVRAQAEYERTKELFERDLVSRSEYDNARADLSVAESEEKLWQTRVDFGSIRAPADAVVTRRFVEEGDAVSAHEAIFRITDMSMLVVRVGISELDAVHLDRGDEVGVSIDAYLGREFSGSIRRIFPSVEEESRLVTVEVALDDIPAGVSVRPGNLARLSFTVDRRENVIAVPSEALLASTRERSFVYVIEDERLIQRDVVPGVQRRNLTEIREGLQPGDIIVATNPTNLAEGTKVRVTQWRE
jgi:membrane fusion protein, multidrug efflux system